MMSESSAFSFPSLGWRRGSGLDELAAVVELLGFAALVTDLPARHVLYANGRAERLVGTAHGALAGTEIKSLLPGWDERLAERLPPISADLPAERPEDTDALLAFSLERPDDEPLEVYLLPAPLPGGKRLLLGLQPVDEQHRRRQEAQRHSQFWEHLRSLAEAFQADTHPEILNRSLPAIQALSGAAALAVYRVSEHSPELNSLAAYGQAQLLPERISAADAASLRQPQVWTLTERPACGLHRQARLNGLAYLASVPLGSGKAFIGLLAAGDRRRAPVDNLLAILQVLATAATSIMTFSSYVQSLEEANQDQDLVTHIYDSLEEAVQEGLFVLSPDLAILKLNTTAEVTLGYTSEEARGQPVENVLIGSESLLPALASAQDGNPATGPLNLRLYRRHGEDFPAQVRTLPIFVEGAIQRILVLVRDLSEQEQIREHTQQLEQRALLGEVTAVFAHEVRNPINNISTGLQVMTMNLPQDDPHQAELARMIQDCDRLAELMKSVLSFSRPTDYEMELLDLGGLIQRLAERLKPRMAHNNVQYSLGIEAGLPAVMGNARALEQVFSNLIMNAVQAMSETGGQLSIKLQWLKEEENGPGSVEVLIADTGPGIPADVIDNIFKPFFTTKNTGTGLGLAIAKRIITAHKGAIWPDSYPGATIFHIKLPLAGNELTGR